MRIWPFSVLAVSLAVACSGSDAGIPAGGAVDGGPSSADGGGTGADSGGPTTDAGGDGAPVDGGSDAGPDAAAWTPKQLAGLSLWLDDTVGIIKDPSSARVARWQDQSGLGNHAVAAGGDGVTSAPKLTPSAVGGKDAIECDLQTYLTIPSATSLQFGTGDFGIVMVTKAVALGSLFTKLTPEGLSLTLTADATLRLQTFGTGGGTALLAGTPTASFSLVVARGANLRVRVNASTAAGAASTADVSGANAPVTLCQSGITTKISLAEVIVVKGTLSDAALAKTTAYVKAKFGF